MDVTQSHFFVGAQSCCALRNLAARASGRSSATTKVGRLIPGGQKAATGKSAPLQILLLCGLFALIAPAARAADEVIYPRGTAAAEKSAAPAAAGGLQSYVLLGAAAVAAAAGWWLWSKRRTGAVNAGPAKLAIVESRSLGSRQYLVVADYDGRKFLLSVCPGSIDLLTPLDGNPPPPK